MGAGLVVRDLNTRDIFKVSKLLRALNMKEKIKLFFKGIDTQGKTPEQIITIQKELGMDLISDLIDNMGDAESEAMQFFGGLVGKSAEEFSELPVENIFEILRQLKEQKGLKSFLSLAAR